MNELAPSRWRSSSTSDRIARITAASANIAAARTTAGRAPAPARPTTPANEATRVVSTAVQPLNGVSEPRA